MKVRPKSTVILKCIIGGASFLLAYTAGYFANTQSTSLPVSEEASTKISSSLRSTDSSHSADDGILFSTEENFQPRSRENAEKFKVQVLNWSTSEPEEAIAYVTTSVKPEALARELLDRILESWVAREPQVAWDWTKENFYFGCCNVIKHVSMIDGEMAWTFAKEFSEKNPENSFMAYYSHRSVINGQVEEGNYTEAIALALRSEYPTFGDEGYMDRTLEHIFYQWSLFNPEEAQQQLSGFIAQNPEYKDYAESGYFSCLALTDPDNALKYGEELPEEHPYKESIMEMAITRLSESNYREEAIIWLNERKDDSNFDLVRMGLASHKNLIHNDLNTALELAASVTREDVRSNGYHDLIVEWMLLDQEAASNFLNESDVLTEEQSEKARRAFERRKSFRERPEYVDGIF